jgi:hypothetical protein
MERTVWFETWLVVPEVYDLRRLRVQPAWPIIIINGAASQA